RVERPPVPARIARGLEKIANRSRPDCRFHQLSATGRTRRRKGKNVLHLVRPLAHFHASLHISGYQRPSSISIRSKSVITLPSSLSPYSLIISGINPSD